MTTLLALRKDGVSYLASDTCVVASDLVISQTSPKIFAWGRFAVAFTGGTRILALVENYDGPRDEPTPWAVSQKLRELMLADGWLAAPPTENGERLFGVSGFIAGPDDVYFLCSGLSLTKLEEGVPLGLGSGRSAAQAAALVALHRGVDPLFSIQLGISAACAYDVYSGGTCEVVSLGSNYPIMSTCRPGLVRLRR